MIVEMSGASTKISNPEVNLFCDHIPQSSQPKIKLIFFRTKMSQKHLPLTTATGALTGARTAETVTRFFFICFFFKSWHQLGYEILICFLFFKNYQPGYQMPDKGHSNGSKFCDQEKVRLEIKLSNCPIVQLSNCQIVKLSNCQTQGPFQCPKWVDCSSNIC